MKLFLLFGLCLAFSNKATAKSIDSIIINEESGDIFLLPKPTKELKALDEKVMDVIIEYEIMKLGTKGVRVKERSGHKFKLELDNTERVATAEGDGIGFEVEFDVYIDGCLVHVEISVNISWDVLAFEVNMSSQDCFF